MNCERQLCNQGMVSKECANCGTSIQRSTSHANRNARLGRKDYCSRMCANRANAALTGPFDDLSGKRFARWTVETQQAYSKNGVWLCVCDCGTRRSVLAASLKSGRSRSCGCLKREVARAAGDRSRTHGMAKTSTYNIWSSMVERCHNPNRKDFYRYGGLGIEVCERWHKFENFLADMGVRPAGLSLDRIDGTKGYGPSNCRWATPREQVQNSSAVRLVTINGRTQCVTDWLAEIGLSSTAHASRVKRGWTVERSLATPPDSRFNWKEKQ